ncbi:hypothetical protein MJO28_009852 [Puccinia striiformis f. sp. tritici]|uniref:Uncharacterized protein n=1 Tax=Puccinia striiformis f. sp. tritici TaxID=168172 RepID=A0ACC0EA98_9BASI|nr:hypothetical protein MJO28_009852 [Puccinia striiformis f. sp. tritici]
MIFGALSGAEEEDAKDNEDKVIDPDIDQYLEQPETPNPDTDRPLTPLEALLKSINARINTEANLEPSALLDDTTTDVLDPTDINNPTGYLSTSADKSVNLSVDEAERTNPNPTSRLSTTANRTTLLSASEAEDAHRTPKRIRVTAENVTGIEGPSSIGKSDCSLPDEVHQKNASLLNRISNKEKRVTSEQYHQQRQTIVSLEERFAKVKRTNTSENYTLSSPIVLFTTSKSFVTNKHHQAKHIATVICSMVAFALNRRANRSQLLNAIRFLACGISETVNEYAHYMGLCSSRKTAIQALRSLSADSQDRVEDAMDASQLIAPLLCIDNLDMEERVHKSTVGKQTRMFHGTWGYIHIPSKTLMDTLDPSELTLASYHASLQKAALMVIEPDFFLPSDPSGEEYALVLKSQIARVMLKYVATPADKKTMLPLDPPTVKQISTKAPNIHMLKLMDESDNSAEGIGQVMEALQRQSGLEPIDFFGRLQLVDGNLGTCQIFNALRSLRLPSEYCNHNLNNVHFTLGAAHTLWNIAQTILTHHFGNPNKSDDLGVWQYLDAIGIAPEKVIQKKDFTKMIQAMELVHEIILNIQDKLLTEQLPTMPTPTWNDTVERCYKLYCSPEARDNVFDSDPVLLNLLIRLQDFSTVIEASRAMKAGDTGPPDYPSPAPLFREADPTQFIGITKWSGEPFCGQGFSTRDKQLLAEVLLQSCGDWYSNRLAQGSVFLKHPTPLLNVQVTPHQQWREAFSAKSQGVPQHASTGTIQPNGQ